MISEPLASILRSNRVDFNARFVEARRRFPGLNGEAFSAVLREMVDPAVTAVAAVDADSAAETASVAYDCALELTGQNLAGPGARNQAIAEGWRRLLPAAARHLAEAPRSVLPAISNALHNLTTTPGCHPDRWLYGLSRLAGQCASADEFLRLGQVAAWRCGMAHYRSGALQLLAGLPEALALQVLGVKNPPPFQGEGRGGDGADVGRAASCGHQPHPHLNLPPEGEGTNSFKPASPPPPGLLPSSEEGLCSILARLSRDRWYNPAHTEQQDTALRPAAQAGAFRGFGGLFIEPPMVAVQDDAILVRSVDECWQLTADCFGATFHRCDPRLFTTAAGKQLPDSLRISGTTVRRSGFSLNLGHLGAISSAAATADTLALTSPLTHAVTLVALT